MPWLIHVLLLAIAWLDASAGAPSVAASVASPATPPVTAAASVWTYCTSSTSAFGCRPTMSWSGVPSVSMGSGFVLTTTKVDGQRSGAIYYSLQQHPNMGLIAGTTSYKCIQAPVQAMGTQNSGGTLGLCDGALSVDWSAWIAANPAALGQPVFAGMTFWVQERHQCTGYSTNRSNALAFVALP
jgi:hypothetical protein